MTHHVERRSCEKTESVNHPNNQTVTHENGLLDAMEMAMKVCLEVT
jgi:hypothetical protein